jgi:hypothetical protein
MLMEEILHNIHTERGLLWESIEDLQVALGGLDETTHHHTEAMQALMPVTHHLENGMYTREIFMPKGQLVVSFIHKQNHPSFFMSGEMSLLMDTGEVKRVKAPMVVVRIPHRCRERRRGRERGLYHGLPGAPGVRNTKEIMSGVILATAIGGAAVSTGAVVAAGIGAGTTLYGGAKSFSDANKARKRGEAAERAADKAIEEAKRRVDVNAYEQLSIAKEPYELMRDALLTQGATGMQAGVEGETRGAAATAGRMQMAQNLQQGQVRGQMGQRMDEINKLVAGEDKRRQLQLAGIAMEEAAGAQLAVRDAEEDRAAYIAQGVGTLGGIAEGLSSSYAAGDFGRIKARGLAAESENVGELLAGLDAFGMPTEREQRQAQRQAQANNMVDFPQPMSRREERQLNRAANDIQRAQAQAAVSPTGGCDSTPYAAKDGAVIG